MAKKPTVNAMLLDTLRTSDTETPKYYDELISLGYELKNQNTESTLNLWQVNGTCLSKGCGDGRSAAPRLYTREWYWGGKVLDGARYLGQGFRKIKKIDLERLLAVQEQRFARDNELMVLENGSQGRPWLWRIHPFYVYNRHEVIEQYYKLHQEIAEAQSVIKERQEEHKEAQDALEQARVEVEEAWRSVTEAQEQAKVHEKKLNEFRRQYNLLKADKPAKSA